MKYLSLLIFFFAMQWSWSLIHKLPRISEHVHMDIQADLKDIIIKYIQKNKARSKNIRFERFWTESIKENQVKATFIYSFEDEIDPTRIKIEGYAILKRDLNTSEKYEYWKFDQLYILNNHLNFIEPMKIDTKEDDSN